MGPAHCSNPGISFQQLLESAKGKLTEAAMSAESTIIEGGPALPKTHLR